MKPTLVTGANGHVGNNICRLLVARGERVRAMIRRTSQEGYLGCVGAFLGLDLEDRLPSIRARTIYISGAEDRMGGPPALMAGLAAKVPGARHASVPKAAHIANIQNAEGFNRVLVDFLKEEGQ